MDGDRIKTYGGNLRENLIQARGTAHDFVVDDIVGDEKFMTEEEAAAVLAKFQTLFPAIVEYMDIVSTPYIVIPSGLIHPRTARDIQLAQDIAEFEAWQQTPDDDDDHAAIHVALLLSKENRIVPPEELR